MSFGGVILGAWGWGRVGLALVIELVPELALVMAWFSGLGVGLELRVVEASAVDAVKRRLGRRRTRRPGELDVEAGSGDEVGVVGLLEEACTSCCSWMNLRGDVFALADLRILADGDRRDGVEEEEEDDEEEQEEEEEEKAETGAGAMICAIFVVVVAVDGILIQCLLDAFRRLQMCGDFLYACAV